MNSREVGIVGAGIHGASVAYHLGRAGVDTAVFEQWVPAAGPTGRSSAICRAGYTNRFLAQMAHEAITMLENLGDLTGGGSASFVRTGMLYLHRAEDADLIEGLVAQMREVGIEADYLGAEQLGADHPQLALDDGCPAVWEAGAGHADPAGATTALIDDAARHGVTVSTRTRIVEVAEREGGGAILTARDGTRTRVSRLVIAAGPWTAPLARQVGADLPLTVERHIVATFSWGDAAPIPFVLADVPGGYYLKPEKVAQYGLGSTQPASEADPDDYQEDVATGECLALAEPAIRRIPDLADSHAAGGWASLYDVSPDWQPVIGQIGDGIYVSAGTSGHGFKLAPALGQHIAGLVTDTPYDRALDQFSLNRFEAGRHLAAGFGSTRILG